MENIQEQPEVLIARNNETGQVGAVVGQNPDGTPQMADAKTAKLSDLVKFSKGQNPLEAFLSNFMRQAKNPSTFGFFKVLAEQFEFIGPAMSDMVEKPTENADLLRPYAVDMNAYKQEQTQEQPKHSAKAAPIDPDKVDWASIEKEWGIKRETLQQSGALDQMVYNHKSPQLFTVTPQFGNEKFEAQARLSFRTNPDGTYTLVPHFIKNEPKLDVPFNGYEFTKEDKENLLKTGNLGKVVPLTDPKTGETKNCLVSIDRMTNDIEAMPVDKIFIKNHIGNTELSMQEIGILKEGGTVFNKEIELKNGRKFTSDLQYNADKRDVEFVKAFSQKQSQGESQGQRNTWIDKDGNPKRITKWKGQQFSEQQIADYVAGKKIEIANVPDKSGKPCTVFIQFDKEKQRPVTEYHYKEKKVVGVAEESKTQYAVNNQGKTNEATKNVTDPLVKGQTEPKNEQQKAQQRKPKGPKV